MDKAIIDIGNPHQGRYMLAKIEIARRITDFDSFKRFIKEEKDSRASWSDEKEKAFNERIDDLMEKDPEFKKEYTIYSQERKAKKKRAQSAIPLDDKEKAQKMLTKRKAIEKLKAYQQKRAPYSI